MKFHDFINILISPEVDNFWDNLRTVPQDAIDKNWKYSFRRDGKVVPVKWFITELGKSKGLDIDFQSHYYNRDDFAQKFSFEIDEALAFDQPDLSRFRKYYENQVIDREQFQDFIHYCHNIMQQVEISPYRVRMAHTQSNEAMMIVGMRAVYRSKTIGWA